MSNITITNNSLSTVILADAVFNNDVIQLPGADTYAEGTILARKEVVDAITPAAGANTGDGTVTLATVAAGDIVPQVGTYTLTVIEAVANGGIFNLTDPGGNIVASYLPMTVGAGAATAFTAAGLNFTITDGATDFIVGDSFTLPVVADGDLVIYATAGTGGAQVPLAVLTYDITTTGAADVVSRVLVGGRVRREQLVIDAGGTVTDAIVDALRHYGITAEAVDELNINDNQ